MHEVALFPTPLRPAPERWRSNRFVSYSGARLLTQRPDLHYYWIAFPKHFDAVYHGLPFAKRSAKQRELRERVERFGARYIPYAKLTAAPSGHPKTLANTSGWMANEKGFTVPPAFERKLLAENTRWKPGQPYSYPVCTDRFDYLEWIRDVSIETLVTEQTDGIYYDFGSITRMCERRANASEARTARTDLVAPEFWFYFNLREFYRELYEAAHAENPEALLTVHTHGQPRALAAWLDYIFIGETLNVHFSGDLKFYEAIKQPQRYTPDYLDLPEGFMEAVTFPRVGGITSWLPELKWADADRLARFQRGFLAWVLVNDVHIWHANSDFRALVDVYNALDEFGSLDDAKVHPWWGSDSPIKSAPDLQVTAYSRPDALLVVAANFGEEAVTRSISIDPARGITKVRELERGDRWEKISGNRFEASIPPGDFRLFLVRP